jgi:hypothetical protein
MNRGAHARHTFIRVAEQVLVRLFPSSLAEDKAGLYLGRMDRYGVSNSPVSLAKTLDITRFRDS